MLVHLLRHAEAEDVSPSGPGRGPAPDRGRAQADEVRREGDRDRWTPGYDAVLVSPLVRARQTAEPVAEACGFAKPLTETKALAPNADPVEVLHELARLKPGTVALSSGTSRTSAASSGSSSRAGPTSRCR